MLGSLARLVLNNIRPRLDLAHSLGLGGTVGEGNNSSHSNIALGPIECRLVAS